jgi:hypothetical protein
MELLMKWARYIFLVLVVGGCVGAWMQAGKVASQAVAVEQVRFGWVDVVIDSGKEELGAYQFELTVEKGTASVVGIEGGEGVFGGAPYYDPAAMAKSRVIVAAYSVAEGLPAGKTRVARVHVQMVGAEVGFGVKLMQAVGKDGQGIEAKVEFLQGATQ